jgi:archaellin
MALKYSQEDETILDISAGFGGRMLGAVSCHRKYIGIDPWTTDELTIMAQELELPNVELINSGSENVRLSGNSIDFCYSSPPYFDQEYYTSDITQAYNQGDDYFYGTYWKQTLDNVKYMLKPDKWFGLNVLAKYDRMITMAKEQFGEPIEQVSLRTIRSHLGKKAGVEKAEYVYMFRNNK